MAFRFSLESVLRLRLSSERQEQGRLELAAQAMYRAQDCCEALKVERKGLEDSLRRLLLAGTESSELHLYLSARAGLDQADHEAQAALMEAQKQWNEQRAIFLKARSAREVVESIRDNQREAYMAQQVRRDQQEIDDLFSMRHSRG